MTEQISTRYLSCAETAKLVRAALKRDFPGVKFTVKSSVYSMGASIHVGWDSGDVDTKAVEACAKVYEGADFDGMTDSRTSRRHYLKADGSVMLRHAEGSYSYQGVDNRELDALMAAHQVEAVHFGANYIFCSRHWQAERDERIAAEAAK